MKAIFLPTLKSIRVQNFSLYQGDLDLNYEFVNGINLVFGGNGVGKTTFTQLIKYGLIGLYKKDYGFRQTYKGNAIEKRGEMAQDYFSKRMDYSVNYNNDARLILTFYIQDRCFVVTRRLLEPVLEKVTIEDISGVYNMIGEVTSQSKYERLDNEAKKSYLQYAYEDLVAKSSKFNSFDDLIFFVNDILFFDENHRTVLWDEGGEGIQERLSSKYLIDPKLDTEREDAIRKTKYFDSLSRHRSEDIRALRQVINTILKNKERIDLPVNKLIIQLEQIRITLEKQRNKSASIQNEREAQLINIRIQNNEKNIISRKVQQFETQLRDMEIGIYESVWSKLNPRYQLYLDTLNHVQSCPLCNKSVSDRLLKKIANDSSSCILCSQELAMQTQMTNQYEEMVSSVKPLQFKLQQIDNNINRSQERLESLDNEYKILQQSSFSNESKLRQLQYNLNTQPTEEDKGTFELKTLFSRINDLELDKDTYAVQSREQESIRRRITNLIETENAKITQQMSTIFSQFAEKFLGVPCFLSYDDYKDGRGKRYVPVIDGKPRLSSDELSESQRFFVDHSYRMSLLHLFYQEPSFFVCETPDSSLDISYEQNAADVFLLYLSQPNALILTSNLNNSQFLEYILSQDVPIGFLNLLEIGRSSLIQRNSLSLNAVLNKIMNKLNH